MTLKQLRRIKATALKDLMKMPGVTGVGIGWKYVGGKRTNELSIRVLVEKKRDVPAATLIPCEIMGAKTDVIERKIRPLMKVLPVADAEPNADTKTYDPLRGGISVGACRNLDGNTLSGTLGCIVTDNQSDMDMLLSNYHVLALDQGFAVGDNIVQPSQSDGGDCPQDVVGTLERAVLGGDVDAAVAFVTNLSSKCDIVNIGNISGFGSAEPGTEVRKRGRTTGVTSGNVDAVSVTITVPYDGIGDVTLNNQIEISTRILPISVQPGLFIAGEWTNVPSTTSGEVTVELTPAGITVTVPNGSLSHLSQGNTTLRYMVYGSGNHVLILDTLGSIGPITRRVTSVDISTVPPTEKMILTGGASGPDIPLPVVQHSMGDGSVFLIYSSSGTQLQNLVMYRSGIGEPIFAGPPSFVATGETRGEATETELIIHYSIGGVSNQEIFPLFDADASQVFSLPGDSGSVVVDNSRRVLGLLFAGNEEIRDENGVIVVPQGAIAYANEIEAVMHTLDISLCKAQSGAGGGIPGGGIPGDGPQEPLDWKLSVLNIAADCLDTFPTFTLRSDIFSDNANGHLSLRQRLVELRSK